MHTNRLRELTTSEIGRLTSVMGVVTRTSEVRPELLQGTFKCLECGGVIKNVEQQYKYTEVRATGFSFARILFQYSFTAIPFLFSLF